MTNDKQQVLLVQEASGVTKGRVRPLLSSRTVVSCLQRLGTLAHQRAGSLKRHCEIVCENSLLRRGFGSSQPALLMLARTLTQQ